MVVVKRQITGVLTCSSSAGTWTVKAGNKECSWRRVSPSGQFGFVYHFWLSLCNRVCTAAQRPTFHPSWAGTPVLVLLFTASSVHHVHLCIYCNSANEASFLTWICIITRSKSPRCNTLQNAQSVSQVLVYSRLHERDYRCPYKWGCASQETGGGRLVPTPVLSGPGACPQSTA